MLYVVFCIVSPSCSRVLLILVNLLVCPFLFPPFRNTLRILLLVFLDNAGKVREPQGLKNERDRFFREIKTFPEVGKSGPKWVKNGSSLFPGNSLI